MSGGNGGMIRQLPGYVDPRACIGMPPEHRDYRWRVLDAGDEFGWYLPIIAPTAIVEAFASVDGGLERATTIGDHAFVMKHAHVGHDAIVGDHCNLAPHCVLGGHVVLDSRVRVGIGAMIRPRVHVGYGATIGAGAVVVKDVPAGAVRVGNPACSVAELRARHAPAFDYAEEWAAWYDAWHSSEPREEHPS